VTVTRVAEAAGGETIRILLIGPLPPPMGGNTRHFLTLIEDLNRRERFRVDLVNTSRGREHSRPVRNLVAAFKTLAAAVAGLRHADIVSYHASNRGMFLFGPFVVVLGKLFSTPTVLRIFGGSFGDFYRQRGALGRWVIRRLILSADIVLLQTRRAMSQLQPHASGRLEWFSTYVKPPARGFPAAEPEVVPVTRTCTQFVFLGHLWRVKGLETMHEAAPDIPDGCSIDIFGPLDEYTEDEIRRRGAGRVRYCGFLRHEEVDDALRHYDCLLLPTYHPSEGYPGVIAEAYAHALPVITTNWLAIPEIVDETSGILIEPRDARALVAAITSLRQDRGRWLRLKEGAHARAKEFDHAYWSGRFAELCEQATRK
jgi:glycosyltransferase involved in cell wall biosynthesis